MSPFRQQRTLRGLCPCHSHRTDSRWEGCTIAFAGHVPRARLSKRRLRVCARSLLCWSQNSYGAENLECPEIGAASVPDLTGDASGGGLFVSENPVDLANEINEAINRLQIASPNISWSDVQNVLIAEYCRVVARKARLTAAERWSRMRQFTSVVEQQITANMMAPGELIVANVPLSPGVFRELRSQAAASGQTTTQLMAAILTRAAGR